MSKFQARVLRPARRARLISGLAVAVVGCLVATGCASGDGSPGSGSGGSGIRVVLSQTPFSLDPCDSNHSANGPVLLGNITESLVDMDPDSGDLGPGLATEWTTTDNIVWDLTLRPDVKFHNGESMTAEGVAAWFKRILTPETNCYLYGSVLTDNVQDVVAVDESTVSFKLGTPDPVLPRALAFVSVGLVPEGDPTEKINEPVGTGPYEFVSYSPGSDIKLERFDDYWGEAPDIESVSFAIREESSVRAAMAKAGEVDVATAIGPQDAEMDGAVNYPVSETLYYRLDVNHAPLNDKRVREAIGYAIDRQTLVDNVLGGLGTPANEIFVDSVLGYSDNVTWSFDPDRAKELLAEAKADGVDVDAEFEVYGQANDRGTNGSELEDTVSAMLNQVGLNSKVVIVEDRTDRMESANPPKPPVAMVQNTHGNSTRDGYVSLNGKLGCQAPQTPVCDDELTAILAKAAAASEDERDELLQEAAEYQRENLVVLIPVAHLTDTIVITNPKLKYTPNPATSERLVIADMTLD